MAEIDVDGLHRARADLRAALAEGLFEWWLELYRRNAATGPTSRIQSVSRAARCAIYRSVSCARRAARGPRLVRTVVLAHYRDGGQPDRSSRCAARDRQRAVARRIGAAAVIEDFHTRWSAQKLVIDQWFSVQAACPRPGALARVRRSKPSRISTAAIRIGCARCTARSPDQNPVNFHARDGAGYRFLAGRVTRIDRANPQIAARLLAPLTRWRRYDAARRNAMRDALRSYRIGRGDLAATCSRSSPRRFRATGRAPAAHPTARASDSRRAWPRRSGAAPPHRKSAASR